VNLEGPPFLAIGIFHGASSAAVTGLRLDISIVLHNDLKYFQLLVPNFIHYMQVIRTLKKIECLIKHDSMELYLYAFLTSAITELHGRVIYAVGCTGRRGDAVKMAVRSISISYGA
jgi:hypothetical protein